MPLEMTGGSSAQNPDLSWSQLRETILMLGVAVGQIEHALTEGNDSVSVLAKSFSNMFFEMDALRKELGAMDESFKSTPLAKLVTERSDALAKDIDKAIVAFQFYDRLSQRLTHVSETIESLGELLVDNGKLYNPTEWVSLQNAIRGRYTMETERAMFDAVLKGGNPRDVVREKYSQAEATAQPQGTGDMELF